MSSLLGLSRNPVRVAPRLIYFTGGLQVLFSSPFIAEKEPSICWFIFCMIGDNWFLGVCRCLAR